MKNKLAQSLKNFSFSVFKTFFTLLVGFIATPILLEFLGQEKYGSFKLLTDWFSYFFLLELGAIASLYPLMAKAKINKDQEETKDVFSVGTRFYIKVLPLFILASLIFYHFLPQLIEVKQIYMSDLRFGFLFLAISFLFLPINMYRINIESNNRYDIVSITNMFQGLSTVGLSIYFAYLGWGIKGQAIAFTFGLILSHIIYYKYSVQSLNFSFFDVLKEKKNEKMWKEMKKLNISGFIFQLTGYISLHADNIVISLFLSPSHIVPFYLTQRIPDIMSMLLNNIGNSIWAPLVHYYHEGDHINFQSKFVESNKFISIIAGCFLVPTILGNEAFVNLWVGEKQYISFTITILACLIGLLKTYLAFWGWLFTGTKNINQTLLPASIAAATNVFFSIVLTYKYSYLGPLLGTLISFIFISIPMILWRLRRIFEISTLKTLGAIAPSFLMGFAFVFFCRKYFSQYFINLDWSSFIFTMIIISTVYFFLSLAILLNKNERDHWIFRIKNIYRTKFD